MRRAMTRRLVGMFFISISTILFSMRYIAAAIYGAGISINNEYSKEVFHRNLLYIGNLPLILSIISLVLGTIYLIWAEFEIEREKRN